MGAWKETEMRMLHQLFHERLYHEALVLKEVEEGEMNSKTFLLPWSV